MALEEHLARSQQWSDASNELIDGTPLDKSPRTRVAVSLLHLALEHQKGIHVLVANGIGGSALALLRPQTEACIRGVWYQWCATDVQVQKLICGDTTPSFGTLVIAVEKTPLFQQGAWLNFKKQVWPTLNDYTHGGQVQVMARNTANEIAPNFHAEHLANTLQGAATLAYLASIAISDIANDAQLKDSLIQLHQRIYARAP